MSSLAPEAPATTPKYRTMLVCDFYEQGARFLEAAGFDYRCSEMDGIVIVHPQLSTTYQHPRWGEYACSQLTDRKVTEVYICGTLVNQTVYGFAELLARRGYLILDFRQNPSAALPFVPAQMRCSVSATDCTPSPLMAQVASLLTTGPRV